MSVNLIPFGKAANHLTAERGLAGAHITDDDIQTPAQ